MNKSIVIGIYGHPAFYPPTLNAVNLIAKRYEVVYLVFRNIEALDWKFPENVVLLASGKRSPIRVLEQQSIFKKIAAIFRFAWLLLSTIQKAKPRLLLVYDPLIWLPLFLVKPLFPSGLKIWYHNHDVADPLYLKWYSIFGLAVKAERKYFPKLDYFSLPSLDRKKYFPMDSLRGRFFFLPNYPSAYIFNQFNNQPKPENGPIKLLFQGSIGPHHGFEEIIPLLGTSINERHLTMELVGFIQESYHRSLIELAKAKGTDQYLIIKPPMPYLEVVKNAQLCHIGLAIYCKKDLMNSTIGTASNKIYEYAASNLPVLLYDNQYFRNTFANRSWVNYTDLTRISLIQSITFIIQNYSRMSLASKIDFDRELSFEKVFEGVNIEFE